MPRYEYMDGCTQGCLHSLRASVGMPLLLLSQAACTAKELKELVTMPNIAINATPEQLAVSEADQAAMKVVRLKRRIFELISNVSL